jgi:hypothetical protein
MLFVRVINIRAETAGFWEAFKTQSVGRDAFNWMEWSRVAILHTSGEKSDVCTTLTLCRGVQSVPVR